MMTNNADKEKIKHNPISFFPLISDSTKIEGIIHFLEITIKIGKYFPLIMLSLAGLNLLLAVNYFLTNSISFAILNLIFAVGGFIYFIQSHQSRKAHSFEYQSSYNKNDKKQLKIITELK